MTPNNQMTKPLQDIFTEKYLTNAWQGRESRSGTGSSYEANKRLLSVISDIVKRYSIKYIADLGCGDFNWMKRFDFSIIDYYLGVDIVREIISENRKHNSERIFFIRADISTYAPLDFDLVICKDVLCHLCYADAIKVINNIKKSDAKYLLTTTFTDYVNTDIENGRWRPINLVTEPFNLGQPLEMYENIEDKQEGWVTKGIGLWRLD